MNGVRLSLFNQELADYIDPGRAQFNVTDNNRGDRRNNYIIDSTATFFSNVSGAVLMSGITSPARPWFKLTTQDPDLAMFGKSQPVASIRTRNYGSVTQPFKS